jgi:diaminopimelate epimerase
MKINFSKYNGAGNDFILIDDRENLIDDNESLTLKRLEKNSKLKLIMQDL